MVSVGRQGPLQSSLCRQKTSRGPAGPWSWVPVWSCPALTRSPWQLHHPGLPPEFSQLISPLPGHAQHASPSSGTKGDETLPQGWRPSLVDLRHHWTMTSLTSNKGAIRTDHGRAGMWYLVRTGNSLENDPVQAGFQISRAGGEVGRHQPEARVHEMPGQQPEDSLHVDSRRA